MYVTTRDDATGLMNASAFTFVVDHVIRRASRSGEFATVLLLLLDHAPRPVTTPEAMDSASIFRIARLLRTELRGEDVVARLAEAEFGVALPDTDADGGEIVVGWLAAQFAELGANGGVPSGTSVAIGRATFEPIAGPVKAERLLEAARGSFEGPCSVLGTSPAEGRQALAGSAGANRATPAGSGPERRHLRALGSRDA